MIPTSLALEAQIKPPQITDSDSLPLHLGTVDAGLALASDHPLVPPLTGDFPSDSNQSSAQSPPVHRYPTRSNSSNALGATYSQSSALVDAPPSSLREAQSPPDWPSWELA